MILLSVFLSSFAMSSEMNQSQTLNDCLSSQQEKIVCVQDAVAKGVLLDNDIALIEELFAQESCQKVSDKPCLEFWERIEKNIDDVTRDLSYISSSDFKVLHPEISDFQISNASRSLDQIHRSRNSIEAILIKKSNAIVKN